MVDFARQGSEAINCKPVRFAIVRATTCPSGGAVVPGEPCAGKVSSIGSLTNCAHHIAPAMKQAAMIRGSYAVNHAAHYFSVIV